LTAAAIDNGDTPHFFGPKPSKSANETKGKARQTQIHYSNRIRKQHETKKPLTNAPMIHNTSTKTQQTKRQIDSAQLLSRAQANNAKKHTYRTRNTPQAL
jgi:hypothetical protein